jgi:hypothetical protein
LLTLQGHENDGRYRVTTDIVNVRDDGTVRRRVAFAKGATCHKPDHRPHSAKRGGDESYVGKRPMLDRRRRLYRRSNAEETGGEVLTFMAECFWPGMNEAKVREAGLRAGHAARAASRDGDEVRYLGAILVPADEVAFCLFEGGSSELVSDISDRAEIPFERILQTVRLDGDHDGHANQ